MQRGGVAAEVLHPSLAMKLFTLEPEPQAACFRRDNEWLADFCAYEPDRLVLSENVADPYRRRPGVVTGPHETKEDRGLTPSGAGEGALRAPVPSATVPTCARIRCSAPTVGSRSSNANGVWRRSRASAGTGSVGSVSPKRCGRSRLVGVDVGGTFTDVMAIEGGRVTAAKVPTPTYTLSETSVLKGAEEVGVDAASVFNLASTAGLNAVITRHLPKVALLATKGHRDVLDEWRLLAPVRSVDRSVVAPQHGRYVEAAGAPLLAAGVPERLTCNGQVFLPLDETQAREELELLRGCAVEGVAICLLQLVPQPGPRASAPRLVGEVLGDVKVSVSSEVSPHVREYTRSTTTTIDLLMNSSTATTQSASSVASTHSASGDS